MVVAFAEKLLKENEKVLLRERRSVDRKPFARPVSIQSGKDGAEVIQAFSRDISPIGIGVISQVNWPPGTRAHLTVHTITLREAVNVPAEVRWSEPFGDGWYLTGWHFVT